LFVSKDNENSQLPFGKIVPVNHSCWLFRLNRVHVIPLLSFYTSSQVVVCSWHSGTVRNGVWTFVCVDADDVVGVFCDGESPVDLFCVAVGLLEYVPLDDWTLSLSG